MEEITKVSKQFAITKNEKLQKRLTYPFHSIPYTGQLIDEGPSIKDVGMGGGGSQILMLQDIRR